MARADRFRQCGHMIAVGMLVAAAGACETAAHRNALANADFGPMNEPLSKSAAQSDFAEWLGWTRATHPDLSYSTDLDQLGLRERAVAANFQDGASRRDVWAAMATLNPIFDDAHVGLRLPETAFSTYISDGGAAFDAPVQVTEDGVLVATDVREESAFKAGDRIISVNGVRMADFLAWTTPRIRGESDAIRRLVIEGRFALAFWTYAGGADIYVAETVSKNGRRKRVTYDAARDALRPQATEPFSLAFQDNVAVLRVASFDISLRGDFRAFAEDAFAKIADAGTSRLVIDLRDNGGGAHDVSDILMAYLTATPHAATSSITARITKENQALVPGSRLGDVLTVPFADKVAPPVDLDNRFDGDVAILVGPRTYSQAIAFAATAQDFKIARIAGAPTDGRANQTAQVTKHPLEHTDFIVQSPIYIMTRASGEKGPEPLTPDILIEAAAFDEISRVFGDPANDGD